MESNHEKEPKTVQDYLTERARRLLNSMTGRHAHRSVRAMMREQRTGRYRQWKSGKNWLFSASMLSILLGSVLIDTTLGLNNAMVTLALENEGVEEEASGETSTEAVPTETPAGVGDAPSVTSAQLDQVRQLWQSISGEVNSADSLLNEVGISDAKAPLASALETANANNQLTGTLWDWNLQDFASQIEAHKQDENADFYTGLQATLAALTTSLNGAKAAFDGAIARPKQIRDAVNVTAQTAIDAARATGDADLALNATQLEWTKTQVNGGAFANTEELRKAVDAMNAKVKAFNDKLAAARQQAIAAARAQLARLNGPMGWSPAGDGYAIRDHDAVKEARGALDALLGNQSSSTAEISTATDGLITAIDAALAALNPDPAPVPTPEPAPTPEPTPEPTPGDGEGEMAKEKVSYSVKVFVQGADGQYAEYAGVPSFVTEVDTDDAQLKAAALSNFTGLIGNSSDFDLDQVIYVVGVVGEKTIELKIPRKTVDYRIEVRIQDPDHPDVYTPYAYMTKSMLSGTSDNSAAWETEDFESDLRSKVEANGLNPNGLKIGDFEVVKNQNSENDFTIDIQRETFNITFYAGFQDNQYSEAKGATSAYVARPYTISGIRYGQTLNDSVIPTTPVFYTGENQTGKLADYQDSIHKLAWSLTPYKGIARPTVPTEQKNYLLPITMPVPVSGDTLNLYEWVLGGSSEIKDPNGKLENFTHLQYRYNVVGNNNTVTNSWLSGEITLSNLPADWENYYQSQIRYLMDSGWGVLGWEKSGDGVAYKGVTSGLVTQEKSVPSGEVQYANCDSDHHIAGSTELGHPIVDIYLAPKQNTTSVYFHGTLVDSAVVHTDDYTTKNGEAALQYRVDFYNLKTPENPDGVIGWKDENGRIYDAEHPLYVNDGSPDTIHLYEAQEPIEIGYTATTGGQVQLNDGSAPNGSVEEIFEADKAPVGATAVADEGYHFVGWYAGDELVDSDAKFVPTEPAGGYEDANYTARFAKDIAIKYSVDGPGTIRRFGVVPTNQIVDTLDTENDIKWYRSTVTPNVKSGAHFVGWFLKGEDGSMTAMTVSPFSRNALSVNGPVTADAHYVAVFKDDISVHYGVQGDGSLISGRQFGREINDYLDNESEIANYSRTVTPKDGAGWKFKGWYTQAEDGTLTEYQTERTLTISGAEDDVRYIAVFEEQVAQIIYHATRGGKVTNKFDDVTMSTGDWYDMKGSLAIASKGYSFVGWRDSRGRVVSENTFFKPSKNRYTGLYETETYTAVFKQDKATIKYVSSDTTMGTVTRPSETILVLDGQADGSIAVPASPGYEFIGWYRVGKDGKPTGFKLPAGNHLIPTRGRDGLYDDVTYMAVFKERQATITYSRTAGGSISAPGAIMDRSGQLIQTVGMVKGQPSAVAKENTGYRFLGWYKVNIYGRLGDLVTREHELTPNRVGGLNISGHYRAVFEELTAHITYSSDVGGRVTNGHDDVKMVTGTQRDLDGSLAIAKPGYTFDGWYRGRTRMSNNPYFKPSRDDESGMYESAHYVAKFTENIATITYGATTGGSVGNQIGDRIKVVTGNAMFLRGSTATARPGYRFVGWYEAKDVRFGVPVRGAERVDQPGTFGNYFKPTRDARSGLYETQHYIAVFEEVDVTITYSHTAGGMVMVNGTNVDRNRDGSISHTIGMVNGRTMATAITQPGYEFIGWYRDYGNGRLGAKVEDDNRFVPDKVRGLNVAGAYRAVFRELTVGIRYTQAVTDFDGTATTSRVDYDRVLMVHGHSSGTVDAIPGYQFDGWFLGNTQVGGDFTYEARKFFGLHREANYEARFSELGATIGYTAGVGGTVTDLDETSEVGGRIADSVGQATGQPSATAEPLPGYEFVEWQDADGNIVGDDETFTPEANDGLYADAEYTAIFKELEADYTYSATIGGTVTDLDETSEVGGRISDRVGQATGQPSATANAEEGYRFVGWFPADEAGLPIEGAEAITDLVDLSLAEEGVLNTGGHYVAVFEAVPNVVVPVDRDGQPIEGLQDQEPQLPDENYHVTIPEFEGYVPLVEDANPDKDGIQVPADKDGETEVPYAPENTVVPTDPDGNELLDVPQDPQIVDEDGNVTIPEIPGYEPDAEDANPEKDGIQVPADEDGMTEVVYVPIPVVIPDEPEVPVTPDEPEPEVVPEVPVTPDEIAPEVEVPMPEPEAPAAEPAAVAETPAPFAAAIAPAVAPVAIAPAAVVEAPAAETPEATPEPATTPVAEEAPVLPETETPAEDVVLPATETPAKGIPWGWFLLAPLFLLLFLLREKLYSPVKGRLVGRDELDEMGVTLDEEHDMLFIPEPREEDGMANVITSPVNAKVNDINPETNTITFKTKFDKLISITVKTTQDLTEQFATIEDGDKYKAYDTLFKLDHVDGVQVIVHTENKPFKLDVDEDEQTTLGNQDRIAHFKWRERKHEEPTMTPAGGHA